MPATVTAVEDMMVLFERQGKDNMGRVGVIYPPLESILVDIDVRQRILSDISGY